MSPWVDIALWVAGIVLLGVASWRQGELAFRAKDWSLWPLAIVLLAFLAGALVAL
jgi:hypothetical protein